MVCKKKEEMGTVKMMTITKMTITIIVTRRMTIIITKNKNKNYTKHKPSVQNLREFRFVLI